MKHSTQSPGALLELTKQTCILSARAPADSRGCKYTSCIELHTQHWLVPAVTDGMPCNRLLPCKGQASKSNATQHGLACSINYFMAFLRSLAAPLSANKKMTGSSLCIWILAVLGNENDCIALALHIVWYELLHGESLCFVFNARQCNAMQG